MTNLIALRACFEFELLERRLLLHEPGVWSFFDPALNAIVYPHDGHIVPIDEHRSGGIITNAGYPSRADPAVVGQWSGPTNIGATAIHASLLANGRVEWWDFNNAREMNPTTLAITNNSFPGYEVFCSGHSILPDGRLFVTGGQAPPNGDGLANASIYNPTTHAWTRVTDMYQRRWYPTNTTLSDGDVLVQSGRYISHFAGGQPVYAVANMPQIWDVQTSTWRNLTTALRNDWLYPWTFLAPDGRVFDAGPNRTSFWLNVSGTGQWTSGPTSIYGNRDYGTAVMYRPGKILIAGGSRNTDNEAPTNTAETIDLSQPNPQWQATGSMQLGRRQTTSTILADGTVLVTGGSTAAGFNAAGVNNVDVSAYAAERWNPDTGQWSTLASMAVRRLYHSTALLLPDGRVLSMGGGSPAGTGTINGQPDFNHSDAEIFSPPYLFNGPRPIITGFSANIEFNGRFTISTPDAANISKVTLVRLGSMTHDINMEQRLDVLDFSVSGPGTLMVDAPTNPNLMPPGPYMLFIINNQGVPSVAAMTTLVADLTAPTAVMSEFHFETGHSITIQFNEDINPTSLAVSDLDVQLLPSGPIFHPSSVTYSASTRTATFTFAPRLGNGSYRATLLTGSIADLAGNTLAAPHVLDFFFFIGDADHNGFIDFDDFVLIDNGFNNGLSGFSNGDFNYDGVIDFDDYVLIDHAFNSQ